jgi:GAF domain-containing protein
VNDIHDIVADVLGTLHRSGVRAALVQLNRHSSHRFTALFRFEGDILRNLHLVDRDDPRVERCPDLPVLESYCVYVRNSAAKFVTENSALDARVLGHPKQASVRSYCGLPLFTPDGELFGTICLFDFEALPFSKLEMMVLEEISASLVAAVQAGEWRPPEVAIQA